MRYLLLVVGFLACSISGIIRGAEPALAAPPTAWQERFKPLAPERGADELRQLLVARYNAAIAEFQAKVAAYENGVTTFEELIATSERALQAQLELSDKPAEQIGALQSHLDFLKHYELKIKELHAAAQRGGEEDKFHRTKYLRIDAEIRLLRVKKKAGIAVSDDKDLQQLLKSLQPSKPVRVAVSGQVLIDGKPLTQGHVLVQPEGARSSMGKLDANGRFTLSTYKLDDGVVVGEHDVAIHAIEVINAGSQRRLVPPIYETPSESKLRVKIDGPTDALIINLTWKGSGKEGPYVETFGKE